jgi:hypothetical protein
VLGPGGEDQAAERVGVQDRRGQPAGGDRRFRDVQGPQGVQAQLRAQLGDVRTVREMAGGGSEDVAAVEAGRDLAQAVRGVLQEVRPYGAAQAFGCGEQQAVVGAYEGVAAARTDSDRAA